MISFSVFQLLVLIQYNLVQTGPKDRLNHSKHSYDTNNLSGGKCPLNPIGYSEKYSVETHLDKHDPVFSAILLDLEIN